MSVEEIELEMLRRGFERAAAIGTFTLTRIFERNEAFFEDNPEVFLEATDCLDRSLTCAENGDCRFAWNFVSDGLFNLVRKYPQLVASQEDIIDGIRALGEINRETLNPYWEKYQDIFEGK